MIYRFADLQFDTGRRLLTRDGQSIDLTKLSFDVLKVLVEAAPNLVSHDELIDRVWGTDRVITPENLTQRIKLLRESIGDDAGKPSYIEGVRGQGFRLIPEVNTESRTSVSIFTPRKINWMAYLAATAAVALAAFIFTERLLESERPISELKPGDLPEINLSQGPSIAVLPFVNMSSDPEGNYIGDGISEDVIHTLVQQTNLPIVARTSSFQFRDQNLDGREIGTRLNATHLLEGSVRKSGKEVRVTAQLIDVPTGVHLWSEQFDVPVEELFTIQTEIATGIVGKIKAQLQVQGEDRLQELIDSASIHSRGSASPAAYDAYLQGLRYKSKGLPDDIRQALEHFEQAATLSPEFLPAWRELMTAQIVATDLPVALDYSRTAYDRIEDWLAVATPYHPDAPLFRLAHGAMQALNHYQWETGIAEMEAVLPELQNDSFALTLAAGLYFVLERPQQSYDLAARAFELNPDSPRALAILAALHSLSGRSEELRELLEMDGLDYHRAIYRTAYYGIAGQEEETVKALSFAKQFVPDSHTAIRTMDALYQWQFGDKEKARNILQELVKSRWEQPITWIWVCGLADCDDLDNEFIQQRQRTLVYLAYLNRQDERNRSVLEKLNLTNFPEPSDAWFSPSDSELQAILDRQVELTQEEHSRYVGTYGIRTRQIRISIKDDQLFYEMPTWNGPLIATGEHIFSSLNHVQHSSIEFVPSDSGEIDLCIWEYRGVTYYGYRQEHSVPE
jgi:TolB-like protein/DNA-binding winged helix-turn-helix (wHTH) protein